MFKDAFKFVSWCLAEAVAVVVGLIAGIVCREWMPSLAWAVAALWWNWFLFIREKDNG